MNKYEIIFESLQEQLSCGNITLEEANILNDYAYEKYIEEKTALQKRINDDNKREKLEDYAQKRKYKYYDELYRHKDDDYNSKNKKQIERSINSIEEILYNIDDNDNYQKQRITKIKNNIKEALKDGDIKYAEKEMKRLKKRVSDIKLRPVEKREGGEYLNLQKEKNKFNDGVKKYNYDPKSKTIEIDGVRTPIKYDRYEKSSMYSHTTKTDKHEKKSEMKILNKNRSKGGRDRVKKKINDRYYKGITISKEDLDDFDFIVNHENQHAKDASIQRMIDREPRFDTKYGTSGLDKDTRRKLLKVKKEFREYRKTHKGHEDKFIVGDFEDRIEQLLNMSKKKTKEYKNDKNEKMKDKRKKFDDKIIDYICDHGKSADHLNSHDRDTREFYADLGAMKHGKSKEYSMKTQRNMEKNMRKTQENHETNAARRESRNELKKQGLLNYVEKFND